MDGRLHRQLLVVLKKISGVCAVFLMMRAPYFGRSWRPLRLRRTLVREGLLLRDGQSLAM